MNSEKTRSKAVGIKLSKLVKGKLEAQHKMESKARIYDLCERVLTLGKEGYDVDCRLELEVDPNYISFSVPKFACVFSLDYKNNGSYSSAKFILHDTSDDDEFIDVEDAIQAMLKAKVEEEHLAKVRSDTLRRMTPEQRKAFGEENWKDPHPEEYLAEQIVDAEDTPLSTRIFKKPKKGRHYV